MNAQEQKAVLATCIMAAFADGSQSDLERAEIKRIAEGFARQNPHLATTYQEVLLQKVRLPDVAQALSSKELRTLAYEMAVCVCHADGMLTESENQFLASLKSGFQLESDSLTDLHQQTAAMAEAPLPTATPESLLSTQQAELNQSIVNYAILNGALEIMPHALATMAIIPLQMTDAKSLQPQYADAMAQKSRSLNVSQLLPLCKGNGLGILS